MCMPIKCFLSLCCPQRSGSKLELWWLVVKIVLVLIQLVFSKDCGSTAKKLQKLYLKHKSNQRCAKCAEALQKIKTTKWITLKINCHMCVRIHCAIIWPKENDKEENQCQHR